MLHMRISGKQSTFPHNDINGNESSIGLTCFSLKLSDNCQDAAEFQLTRKECV